MNPNTDMLIQDPDLRVFEIELEGATDFRARRKEEWDENYMLFRNNIITNRLTQRQTINIPLTKYGIATLLKDIDDPPQLYFKEITNDEQKEIFYNEYWKEIYKRNSIPIRDIVDKKQAMLYGRAFKKLNVVDGEVKITLVDPQNVLIHRYTDPTDMDSTPCLIETKIYRTLRDIISDDTYDKEARDALLYYFMYEDTELSEDTTHETTAEKNERLVDLGDYDALDPDLSEKYIELNEVYRYEQEMKEEDGEEVPAEDNQIYRMVVATTDGGNFKLHKERLEDIMGKTKDNFWRNHLPYESWAVDVEATDFWSDGIADIYRPINRVLNSWISQLVENRTLRNFGMMFYNSNSKDFIPQIYEPRPWGWYPVPGNPADMIKPVDVPDLSESLDEIQFLIGVAEKATASTSANAGQIEERSVTLGEVQLALANAKERVQSMQSNYIESWKRMGLKYIKLLEANESMLEPYEIAKRGRVTDKLYRKEIQPKSWKSEVGYTCEIITMEDKQQKTIEDVQKLKVAMVDMQDNVPLREIYQKKLLQFADLSMEDVARVMEFEQQKQLLPEEPMMEENVEATTQAPQNQIPEVPDIAGVQL